LAVLPLVLVGVLGLGLGGCGGDEGVAAGPSRPLPSAAPNSSTGAGADDVVTDEVPPSQTASGLDGPVSPSVAMVDPRAPANGELFLFMPGTGGHPEENRDLLGVAATSGFLAVGLTYDNTQAVGRICGNDLDCYATVRQDDFDGSAPSGFADVAPADSIQSRLVDLLDFLANRHPGQGWARFVERGAPTWSKIVVAGHSQGGGDAAYIAKVRDVEGVVMLASDVDSSATSPPLAATYLETGHLTPLDRYVGFDHSADPFRDKIVTDWNALGLRSLGAPIMVDGTRPPFDHSHELLTSATVPPGPAPSLATHDSTAVDGQTPTCPDGSPAFAPVWRYMMEVAGGLRITSGPAVCTG
jgi:hypothetical protein